MKYAVHSGCILVHTIKSIDNGYIGRILELIQTLITTFKVGILTSHNG